MCHHELANGCGGVKGKSCQILNEELSSSTDFQIDSGEVAFSILQAAECSSEEKVNYMNISKKLKIDSLKKYLSVLSDLKRALPNRKNTTSLSS